MTVLGGRNRVVFAFLLVACSGDDQPQASLPKGVLLASGQNNPYSIAIDGTSVYWTNVGTWTGTGALDGAIMKMPLDGGPPTVLASELCAPLDIAVDDSNVYWTGIDCDMNGGLIVVKVPLDGGPSVVLASDCGGLGMGIAGGFVYCLGASSISSVMRVPVGGGTLTTVAPQDGHTPFALAVDSVNVYWARSTNMGFQLGGPASLLKVLQEGGPPTVLIPAFLPPPILSGRPQIAVDGSNAYWIDRAGDEVNKVAVDGGTPARVAVGQGRAIALAIRGEHAYWSTCAVLQNYRIARGPTNGGAQEVLAVTDSCANDIAVDDDSVYWVEEDTGTVKKVPLQQ